MAGDGHRSDVWHRAWVAVETGAERVICALHVPYVPPTGCKPVLGIQRQIMAITLFKHLYRTYRVAGVSGLWRRVSSPLVWKDALPRLLYLRDRRIVLARRYIKGRGIEIGALHNPLKVTSAAAVTYVDRSDTDGLRKHYPDKEDWPIVDVDIVDDGETLSRIPAASQDFIIANQFFDHCQNPLGTIRHHLSKLKPGGILFYALPNKRLTFDARRPVTPFEHLVHDDLEGPLQFRAAHYREWLELVSNMTDHERIDAKVREFEEQNQNIHFHVWDRNAIDEFVEKARAYLDEGFEVRERMPNGSEVIVILQTPER